MKIIKIKYILSRLINKVALNIIFRKNRFNNNFYRLTNKILKDFRDLLKNLNRNINYRRKFLNLR